MAVIRSGGKADNTVAVPLAHGRPPGGTAENPPSGDWIKHGINSSEVYEQLSLLFNEAETFVGVETRETAKTPAVEVKAYTRTKEFGNVRDIVPKDIPVEVVEHHLPDEELACPQCGSQLTAIDKEDKETLLFRTAFGRALFGCCSPGLSLIPMSVMTLGRFFIHVFCSSLSRDMDITVLTFCQSEIAGLGSFLLCTSVLYRSS